MRDKYKENPKQYYKELAIKEAIKQNKALIRRGLKVYSIDKLELEDLIMDIKNIRFDLAEDTNDLFVALWKKTYLYLINKRLEDDKG